MSRWRGVLLVAGIGLGVTGLSGCTAARNGLGTSVSFCFRVLPEARAAAGASSKFDGVRSLPGRDLLAAIAGQPHNAPPSAPPVILTDTSHQATCLVAFTGNFSVSGVSRGWAPQPGPYLDAIVVVRQSNGDVEATVLLHRLPPSIRFFHGSDFVR